MEVDLADVAIVRALEPKARALLEAIATAMPAIARLHKAGYAGAEWLSDQAATDTPGDGSLVNLARALTWLCEADGDQAAYDYRYFRVGDGETLSEAAKEILSWVSSPGAISSPGWPVITEDMALQRVEALRQYAAAV